MKLNPYLILAGVSAIVYMDSCAFLQIRIWKEVCPSDTLQPTPSKILKK